MIDHEVDFSDPAAIAARAGEPELVSGTDPGNPTITVDGRDVAVAIRSQAVTDHVSAVASVPEVRQRLLELQRSIIGEGGIVVEGRDIGSVVAPDAAGEGLPDRRPVGPRRASYGGERLGPSRPPRPTCSAATRSTRAGPSPRR